MGDLGNFEKDISAGVKARFWAKVDVRGEDECWPWLGAIGKAGYGWFRLFGKVRKAHRASYWILVKEPDAGLHIDHICRNRRCVNPAHLREVTPRVNALENSVSVTAINYSKTHCSKGHFLSEDNVYRRPGVGRRHCRICRRDYKCRRNAARAQETPATGKASGHSDATIQRVREMRLAGHTIVEVIAATGVSERHIQRVMSGKTRK